MSEIRRASIADAAVIAAMEAELFGTDAWSPEMVADELRADHRAYFALLDDGDVIGYAGLFAPGAEGDIQTIAVATQHRGKGLGKALLAALMTEAHARGVTQLFLEVRADNVPAQQLYLAHGFEVIGERPGYYQPGNVSAMVMRCRLTSATVQPGEQEVS